MYHNLHRQLIETPPHSNYLDQLRFGNKYLTNTQSTTTTTTYTTININTSTTQMYDKLNKNK